VRDDRVAELGGVHRPGRCGDDERLRLVDGEGEVTSVEQTEDACRSPGEALGPSVK
jgi:hypothetical protein